jgi:hypothetical protein
MSDVNSPLAEAKSVRDFQFERAADSMIRFDPRSLGPANPQTGYCDPVDGICRIEVKERTRGHPIRPTTNEWRKAALLRDTYWLYVVWDPVETPDREPTRIPIAVKHLDHANKWAFPAKYREILSETFECSAREVIQ